MTYDDQMIESKQPEPMAEVTCPQCGDMFDSIPGGEVECPGCKWRFVFDLEAEDILAAEHPEGI